MRHASGTSTVSRNDLACASGSRLRVAFPEANFSPSPKGRGDFDLCGNHQSRGRRDTYPRHYFSGDPPQPVDWRQPAAVHGDNFLCVRLRAFTVTPLKIGDYGEVRRAQGDNDESRRPRGVPTVPAAAQRFNLAKFRSFPVHSLSTGSTKARQFHVASEKRKVNARGRARAATHQIVRAGSPLRLQATSLSGIGSRGGRGVCREAENWIVL